MGREGSPLALMIHIYVVDQGHNRIAKFSPDGQVLASWGSAGSGDGQFNDPTSVAVDPATNKVYVADPRNTAAYRCSIQTGSFCRNGQCPNGDRR